MHNQVNPPGQSVDSPNSDVKPNLSTLKQEVDAKVSVPNETAKPPTVDQKCKSSATDIKSEIGDCLKQEDTLGDLDLKDFDFDGNEIMNTDELQDLMDGLPEFDKTFIENLDFGDSNKTTADEAATTEGSNVPTSSQPTDNFTNSNSCHNSSAKSSSTPVTSSRAGPPGALSSMGQSGAKGPNGPSTNAAEALKIMAQQHQQSQMQPGPGNGR